MRIVYTAMHGMVPQRGEVQAPSALRAIGACVAQGFPVAQRVIKAGDSLEPLTVVSVATMAGAVTGVYEITGEW